MNTAKILPMVKRLLSAPSLESLMYADKIPFPVNRHIRRRLGVTLIPEKIVLPIPVDGEETSHTVEILPSGKIILKDHPEGFKYMSAVKVFGVDFKCDCLETMCYLIFRYKNTAQDHSVNLPISILGLCRPLMIAIQILRASRRETGRE